VTSGDPPSFTWVMTEHEDLTERLGALGDAPVADHVRDRHLLAMHAAAPAPSRERRGFDRLAVAAAAIVGFAVGSTGFALAGALPDPAQGVAHDVLSVVQVEVPDRPQNRGACVSAAAKAGDRAAKDACPKGRATGVPGEGKGDAKGKAKGADAPGRPAEAGPHPNADTGDCKGKPAWAGEKRKPTPEERAAREACPDDDDDTEELELEGQELDEPRQEAPAEPATPPQPPVGPADPPAAEPADPASPAQPEAPPADAGQPDGVPPAGS